MGLAPGGSPSGVPHLVAGLGCRLHCPAEDILAVLAAAEFRFGHAADTLAAPAAKRHEPGLHEAAARRGLKLLFIDDTALADAQPRCATRSEAARRATGHAAIAEACALAAAGPGATLLLPRIAHPTATCALAGPARDAPVTGPA